MGSIIEKITEFIKEMLQGWVLDNLETMFTDVNTKVGTIAGEVGQTPSSWNAGIFSMIDNLSDTVMVPIAGMIISAILCYELITMVMDKNNMHEMGSEFFFRYLVKACIAVLLVSYTSDITMAIFDVGNHIVTSAAGVITGSTTLDVTSTLQSMFNSQLSTMGIGELIGLGIETMIVSLCMKIISLLITVMLYGRMIEIYLYVSVAPVPFATLSNREWGGIGSNYIKGLCALAFQGFFIMVCVAIYGMKLITVLPDVVKSPKLTADWENALTLVAKGEYSMQEFMDGIADMVKNLVQTYHSISDEQKSMFGGNQSVQEALGKCPKCGGDVVKGKYGAYCKSKCGMNVGKAMGTVLSDTQIKSMLEGKKTFIKGLKGKKGTYDAYLIPEGIEDYSYTKDGKEIKGSQYKVKLEFAKRSK